MPTRPKLPCRYRGCPKAQEKKGYCVEHEKLIQKRIDSQRGTSSERGYDRTWQRFREAYLWSHPLCVECGTGKRLHVDHKVPLSQGGDKFNESNLQTLCHRCHTAKTMRENKKNL
ncbi:MAG: HNH endonuclease [Gammaproteobacteria bacterium]|nr:HNH endonuclease [Gammaproteobacteria bacterium]